MNFNQDFNENNVSRNDFFNELERSKESKERAKRMERNERKRKLNLAVFMNSVRSLPFTSSSCSSTSDGISLAPYLIRSSSSLVSTSSYEGIPSMYNPSEFETLTKARKEELNKGIVKGTVLRPPDVANTCVEYWDTVRATLIAGIRVGCPVTDCVYVMRTPLIMSHFLSYHSFADRNRFCEVTRGQMVIVPIDANKLPVGQNVCLGMLAYAGYDTKPSSRPANRGVCLFNDGLDQGFAQYISYLPILMMACKTQETSELDYEGEASATSSVEMPYNLVVWLATVPTAKTIFGTIEIYDLEFDEDRTKTLPLRSLTDSQDATMFGRYEKNCIRIHSNVVQHITRNGRPMVRLHIAIQECK